LPDPPFGLRTTILRIPDLRLPCRPATNPGCLECQYMEINSVLAVSLATFLTRSMNCDAIPAGLILIQKIFHQLIENLGVVAVYPMTGAGHCFDVRLRKKRPQLWLVSRRDVIRQLAAHKQRRPR